MEYAVPDWRKVGWLLSVVLLCGYTVGLCEGQALNGFAAQGKALDMLRKNRLATVRNSIMPAARDAASAPGATAFDSCYVAELMKLAGDYHANEYYKECIRRAPIDPTYEFLYAQYLRVFRGALEPLFPQAEAHLLAAERKFACLDPKQRDALPKEFESLLARAFADLYQRDGLAMIAPSRHHSCPDTNSTSASLFESLGARGGRSDADFDRQALIRDLTAGVMLAQSRSPLNRAGTVTPVSFLRANIRTVLPVAGVERLRFRGGQAPAIDAFLIGQDSDNAQITNYLFNPSQPGVLGYNAVKLSEYGISVDHPFPIFNVADGTVGFTYRRVRRWGVIEGLPQGREDINQVEVHGAISRFVGPDKVNADFTFVNQGIAPRLGNGLNRDRQLYGGTFTYQIFRFASAYRRQFQNTRGIDLSVGVLHDLENYPFTGGVTAVTRRDYFVSTTIRAFHRFDLNLQPTWFTSDVSTDKSQYNSQYETAGYVLYRILDEERTGGLPKAWHGIHLGFLNVSIPFHHDVARSGLTAFENYKVGAELSAKWFSTARRGVTFLGSARYDVQNFYNLNRTVNIVTGALTMGF